jgi:hypothetical protein
MTNVKKVDCALLPPCAKTVHNKLRRAHFITIIWGQADSPHPGLGLDPLNYGWKDKNGYYTPDWFLGPAVPDELFQEGGQDDETTDDVQNDQQDMPDTDFDDVDDSSAELPWSEDSESETEI